MSLERRPSPTHGTLALAMAIACAGAATPGAQGTPNQPAQANRLTDGGDPERTSWQRHETAISPQTVKGMRLAWKLQLDNEPRQLHALFPPLVVGHVKTPGGVKQIGVVAGVSDNVYGIDPETDAIFFAELKAHVPPGIEVVERATHAEDPAFVAEAVDRLIALIEGR